MAGGLAGFSEVLTEEASRAVNDRGDRLRAALNEALASRGVAGTVLGRGSLMNIHLVPGLRASDPVTNPAQLAGIDPRVMKLYHIEMLLRGQHVTPRGMLALSLPFGDAEVDGFVAAFDDFLAVHGALLPQAG